MAVVGGGQQYNSWGRSRTTAPNSSQQQLIGNLTNQQPLPQPMAVDNSQIQAIEDAMYDRRMRLLQPEFNRREEQLRQRLANQGLPSGSEAYGSDMTLFEDSRNRAFADAADAAVMAGRQELARLQQQDLAERGLLNQRQMFELGQGLNYDLGLRRNLFDWGNLDLQRELGIGGLNLQRDQNALDAAFRERNWNFTSDMALRNQFFNEMGFFMGGAPGPQIGMPQIPGIQTNGVYDTSGLTQYENDYNSYMADVNQTNQQNQMLMALASMFFMSSSKLKEGVQDVDTRRASEIVAKVKPKRWRYKGTSIEFVSPMLEQSPKEIREGDKLNLVNMVGTLWAALQDAQQRIERLERGNV